MYKVAIIDDEHKIREVLKIKIEKYCPQLQLVGEASNADEAFSMVKTEKPDLIFLDIAMPGESGFDFLDRFDEFDFEIVFATGFNEYALEALKVSAVDYILKPFRNDDIKNAVSKAIEKIKNKSKAKQYDVLRHNLNNVGNQDSKIAIANTNSYEFVYIKDIIRCEGWQKYTKIHKSDGSQIVSSYNIGHYYKTLEHYGFYLSHKSHLINKSHVKEYLREGTIVMSDNSQVPVSRRKKDEFVNDVIKGGS